MLYRAGFATAVAARAGAAVSAASATRAVAAKIRFIVVFSIVVSGAEARKH